MDDRSFHMHIVWSFLLDFGRVKFYPFHRRRVDYPPFRGKQASKQGNLFFSNLFLHDCDWLNLKGTQASKQASKHASKQQSKRASKHASTRANKATLDLVLHNCDWLNFLKSKRASKQASRQASTQTSKRTNKQTNQQIIKQTNKLTNWQISTQPN